MDQGIDGVLGFLGNLCLNILISGYFFLEQPTGLITVGVTPRIFIKL